MSPCQPAADSGARLLPARGNADHLLVEAGERREQDRAAVGRDEPERHDDRGPERQQSPAFHRRVAEHRQRELGVLVTEGAHAVGRAAGDAFRRRAVPRDRGRREVARPEVGQRVLGVQAQDDERFVDLHAVPGHPRGHEGSKRAEPVGLVPAEVDRVAVAFDPHQTRVPAESTGSLCGPVASLTEASGAASEASATIKRRTAESRDQRDQAPKAANIGRSQSSSEATERQPVSMPSLMSSQP